MEDEHIVRRDFDPKSLIWPLVIFLVVIGVIWGIFNYISKRNLEVDPTIDITAPVDGETYTNETLTVQGKTNNNKINLMVNGNPVEVDKDGSFSGNVNLNPGQNSVGIVAETDAGKRAERTITVFRDGPTATVPSPVAGVDLSKTGPESFWIPEASALALAGASWYGTRKKLKESQNR